MLFLKKWLHEIPGNIPADILGSLKTGMRWASFSLYIEDCSIIGSKRVSIDNAS